MQRNEKPRGSPHLAPTGSDTDAGGHRPFLGLRLRARPAYAPLAASPVTPVEEDSCFAGQRPVVEGFGQGGMPFGQDFRRVMDGCVRDTTAQGHSIRTVHIRTVHNNELSASVQRTELILLVRTDSTRLSSSDVACLFSFVWQLRSPLLPGRTQLPARAPFARMASVPNLLLRSYIHVYIHIHIHTHTHTHTHIHIHIHIHIHTHIHIHVHVHVKEAKKKQRNQGNDLAATTQERELLFPTRHDTARHKSQQATINRTFSGIDGTKHDFQQSTHEGSSSRVGEGRYQPHEQIAAYPRANHVRSRQCLRQFEQLLSTSTHVVDSIGWGRETGTQRAAKQKQTNSSLRFRTRTCIFTSANTSFESKISSS